jgi:prepilin-type N-terminal cleavage/methylation domain-containing protein
VQRSNENRAGFTLVEVIISIAILSIGIVVLMQAISFSAKAAGISCDTVIGVLAAKDILQELEFKEQSGDIASGEKEVMNKKGPLSWKYTLTLDEEIGLYLLRFALTWRSADRDESIDILSYLR